MWGSLAEYSRALIRLHQIQIQIQIQNCLFDIICQVIEGAAPTMAERQVLAILGDGALKHQFVVGVRDEWMRHELRRLMLRSVDIPFIVVRGRRSV